MQLPLEVTLDASNSSDAEGIVSLNWDCEGDGKFEATSDWTVANGRTHVCTYAEDGAFEATVQATNSLVCTSSTYFVPGTYVCFFFCSAILLTVLFCFFLSFGRYMFSHFNRSFHPSASASTTVPDSSLAQCPR